MRLCTIVHYTIGGHQCGFTQNRSTIDQIGVTNMFEKAHYKKNSGVDMSGSIGNRNKGSSVLYSPWASEYSSEQLAYSIYFTIQSDILNA